MNSKRDYRTTMLYSNYCKDRWDLYNILIPLLVANPRNESEIEQTHAKIEAHKRICTVCTDADNYQEP